MLPNNLKLHKFGIVALKLIVTGMCIYYIVSHILSGNPTAVIDHLSRLDIPQGLLLSIVVLLIPVNWSVEVLKWRFINQRKISREQSMQAVMMGVSLGFLFPVRCGEVMGRAIRTGQNNRVTAISNALFAGMAQFLVTLLFGLLALVLSFLWNKPSGWNWITVDMAIVFSTVGVLSLLLFLLVRRWMPRVKRIKWPGRIQSKINGLTIPSQRILIGVLLLSALRYFVFAVQFALILVMFGFTGTGADLGILIGVYYLVSTLVPATMLGKLGIRESVALFIFTSFMPGAYHVVGATLMIWLLNLALPAVLGSLIILKQRVAKSA